MRRAGRAGATQRQLRPWRQTHEGGPARYSAPKECLASMRRRSPLLSRLSCCGTASTLGEKCVVSDSADLHEQKSGRAWRKSISQTLLRRTL